MLKFMSFLLLIFLITDYSSGLCIPTITDEPGEGVIASFKFSNGGLSDLAPVDSYVYCVTNDISNFEVHVVSLNDADGTESKFFGDVIAGDVKVRLHKTTGTKSRPVKLVLSTENPTNWIVYTNGVNLEDLIVTSKKVSSGSVTIEDSDVVKVWKLHGDYGYKLGLETDEDLIQLAEDWFGFVTSYTATQHASEAIVNTGVADDVAAVNSNNLGVYFYESCETPSNHPFTRGIFKSYGQRESLGCYSGRVMNNQEVYLLSVDGGETTSGIMAFETGHIKVNIYHFAQETLHPVSLILTSYGGPIVWNIVVEDGITLKNITIICPPRYAIDCNATVEGVDSNVPITVLREILGFDQNQMKPSLKYARQERGFVTSYTGVELASEFDLGVGVNPLHVEDDPDYEVIYDTTAPPPTTTEAPEKTTVAESVEDSEEDYEEIYEQYYYDFKGKQTENQQKPKSKPKPNVKPVKADIVMEAAGSTINTKSFTFLMTVALLVPMLFNSINN